jgi:hypothetical protein
MSAEIDFEKSPMQLRFGTNADGTIGMACSADDFHRLLLGLLPIGVGVNHKRLFLRGSVAKLMSAVPLFYVAPAVYPFYLESIGRRDLILNEKLPPLHGESETEDGMNRIIAKLAFAAGYALGLLKSKISPRVNVIAALEAMGQGLLRSGLPRQAPAKE